jgi:hypothetical protein
MSKTGSRAAKRKKMQNPVMIHGHAATPQEARKLRVAILEPRVLSTLCFSSAGLLAGLATGLNHFPNMAAVETISRTMLLAAYLGDPHLDVAQGFATGFAGLVIGGCLGFSALSDAKELGISVLASTILTIVAVVYTGNLWLAGLAFLFGHIPAFLAARRLQQA